MRERDLGRAGLAVPSLGGRDSVAELGAIMADSFSGLLHSSTHEGSDQPALTLARLFLGLCEDQPALERAISAATSNPDRHAALVGRLTSHFASPGPVTEVVGEPDCLALLVALDAAAADRWAGHEPAAALFEDPAAWVQRRPVHNAPAFARQPNQLQHWMRWHWVFPTGHHGITIHVRSSRDGVSFHTALSEALGNGELRVHLGGFDDGVTPKWITPPPRYGCETLSDEERRWASMLAVVQRAASEKAHVLLLPELTITPALRTRLADWLARNPDHPFQIVVPGSFHEEVAGVRRNVAVAFDRFGDVILRHHKLCPMRVTAGGGDVPQGAIEDIEGASRIELVATPLGLLALGICLDFCEEGGAFADLWQRIGPGVVLVPSMSGKATYGAHQRRAHSLHRAHATVSAVAIQPEGLRAAAGHEWSLLHPGGDGHLGDDPSRTHCVKWRDP
jgi:predicted amidohydrolase